MQLVRQRCCAGNHFLAVLQFDVSSSDLAPNLAENLIDHCFEFFASCPWCSNSEANPPLIEFSPIDRLFIPIGQTSAFSVL